MINLLHPCQEDQDVPRRLLLVDLDGGIHTAFHIVSTGGVKVENIHIVVPSLHGQNSGRAGLAVVFTAIEEISDVLGIHCGGGDYQLQISPSLQYFLQESHDNVNLGCSFVNLIEHYDRVVAEKRISHHLPDKNAFRDKLYLGVVTGEILIKPRQTQSESDVRGER